MAIIATLVVLVIAGFTMALVELSSDANRSAALQATRTERVTIRAVTPATPAAATAAANSTTPGEKSHRH